MGPDNRTPPPRPVVKRTARAILLELDPDDPYGPASIVLIRRVRPGAPHPYWITPGGGVERDDRTVVEALHREVDEELGGKIVDVVPAFVDTISHTLPQPPAGGTPMERRSAGPITASGSRISTGTARNTQRQPRCWVTAPETSGPTIEGSTQAEEKAANTEGRSRSG